MTADAGPRQAGPSTWMLCILGVVLALIGLPLIVLGAQLITLGGSWYYGLAGLVLVASGIFTFRRSLIGFWLFAALFAATVVWALAESGFAFWPMVPRLGGPLVIALIIFLCLPLFPSWRAGKALPFGLAAVVVALLAGAGYAAFQPQGVIRNDITPTPGESVADAGGNWAAYGSTPSGTRYSAADQINTENVKDLQVAWTYEYGEERVAGQEDQITPILINDTAYICTPQSNVHAIDVNTGEARWVFDSETDNSAFARCRGVSYYEYEAPEVEPAADALATPANEAGTEPTTPVAPAAPVAPVVAEAPAICGTGRIVLTTSDARMIELDATTGELCADFGTGGIVDLKAGMGDDALPNYILTSAPTVARNRVIVGGFVLDNISTGEPSGVVRAFDARSGELLWAWNADRPEGGLPAAGELYTRGTPNVWSTPAYDDALGLVYLPTGNATPDFWAAHRTEDMLRVSASVVAVDIETGAERWVFQTTHHDVWDYDVASQPALYDVPDGNGGTIPALIQITKRGQIFMLDRRTGEPIAEVEERAVPQDVQEGDLPLSPTQPYSVGMPAIGVEPLTEARMWGATLYDQLLCRIEFKKLRYEGDFTPPTTERMIQWPGYYGGFNWGSAALNEETGMLVLNDMRIAQYVELVPRDDYDSQASSGADMHAGLSPQTGTPFAALKDNFFSVLGVPCQEPPYGTLTGIDLGSRSIAWQVPMGTLEEAGPLGIKTGLQIPIGMPTIGGASTTSGGLVFYAATQDYYLRAMDAATGEELWKGKLPVGSQSTPSTYVSPSSGRQFVVLTAGGARQQNIRGDYVVGFALPEGTAN
nr:membrane-bound PQQ-dependent dehydrogenase, glucose/quinate/shikimate family [uncultured Devosia sp.]